MFQAHQPLDQVSQVLLLSTLLAFARLLELRLVFEVAVVESIGSFDHVGVADVGGIDGELIVVLGSQLAGAGVLELHVGFVEEAEVFVGAVVDAADFPLALVLAFVELQVLVGVGVAGRATAARVLLASLGASAEALVVVVLAVVSADGKVEFGALGALSLDFLFLLSGVVDASAVSSEDTLGTVEPAEVIIVSAVLGEDPQEDARTVVARGDDVGALAMTDQSHSHALKKTTVVISLAVRAADRIVVARAVALSSAGFHSQGDLLVAEKNAVVLIGGSGHGADWLEIKRAIAIRNRSASSGRSPRSGGGSAGSFIGQFDLAILHSAFICVGDSILTTDLHESLGAAGFELTVGIHDLSAIAVVEEVDSSVVQGTQVRVGGVVVAADSLVSPGTEAGCAGDRRVGWGHL